MRSVGAYEAKTHLPKLLEAVQQGETIVITRHGKEVAHLVPPPDKSAKADPAAAVAKWKQTRKDIRLGDLKIRDLIDEGRL